MELQELKDYEMYVLVSPEGHPQLPTLSPDFQTCVAMCQILAKSGITNEMDILFDEGYDILPVKTSIISNGTSEEGFQRAKQPI